MINKGATPEHVKVTVKTNIQLALQKTESMSDNSS